MPSVQGIKYVYSLKQIDDILNKIKETGRPDKLTLTYVQNTWLMKNAQYSAVLDLLKDMEFIDSTGSPLKLYTEYQNPSKSKNALANGIIKAYSNLFKAYPNANDLPLDTIKGYFKEKTGSEKSVLEKIAGTFTRLCKNADFQKIQPIEQPDEESKGEIPAQKFDKPLLPITMNIQIVIPSDATAEQYDKIFSSIRKFLTK